MAKHRFRVRVYGRNSRLAFEERGRTVVKQTGFYTWRNVTAADVREAEYEAIDLIRGDDHLRKSVRNAGTDPPLMDVVAIERLEPGTPFSQAGTGYAFFHGQGAGRPRSLRLAPDARKPGGRQATVPTGARI